MRTYRAQEHPFLSHIECTMFCLMVVVYYRTRNYLNNSPISKGGHIEDYIWEHYRGN